MRQSNRTAIWSNLLYALSQSMIFFVIALVFWFGATLVSKRECSTFQFFVGLMVRYSSVQWCAITYGSWNLSARRSLRSRPGTCSPSSPIFLPPKARLRILSSYWIRFPRSTRNLRPGSTLRTKRRRATFAWRAFTSGTPPAPVCGSFVTCPSKLSPEHTLRWSGLVVLARAPCKWERCLICRPLTVPQHPIDRALLRPVGRRNLRAFI